VSAQAAVGWWTNTPAGEGWAARMTARRHAWEVGPSRRSGSGHATLLAAPTTVGLTSADSTEPTMMVVLTSAGPLRQAGSTTAAPTSVGCIGPAGPAPGGRGCQAIATMEARQGTDPARRRPAHSEPALVARRWVPAAKDERPRTRLPPARVDRRRTDCISIRRTDRISIRRTPHRAA
jgi:hypothetical protein